MSAHHIAFAVQPMDAVALNLISRVLHRWCEDTSNALSSASSQLAAKELVKWFEFGLRDETELLSMLKEAPISL